MDNVHYKFSHNASVVLNLAREISISTGLLCVPKEYFFISLFLTSNTPVYNSLLEKGLDEIEIHEKSVMIIEKFERNDICTSFPLELGNDSCFLFEDQIFKVFDVAKKIARTNYKRKCITFTDLFVAFAETFPDVYLEMMRTFLPNYGTPNSLNGEIIKPPKEKLEIPSSMSSFLTILNDKYSSDEEICHICGRDKETMKLIRVLMKMTKRNAILVGDPGVGKTALVEKFTWMIVTGNCPKQFKDSVILSLDVNAIVAGTKYRGTAEARFMELISFLENHPECILFVDEIHLLLGAGACKDGDLDLANALKPILARGSTRVIGATTTHEYAEYLSKDTAFKRRFEKIVVTEPKTSEIYPMIKNQIKKLEKAHDTTISKKLVDFCVLNAGCFNFETKNPDRTLDLLDKAMVCAELNEHSKVTKQDILENFSINFEKFKKMSPFSKKSTAYHEAGHYIVFRFAQKLSDYNILAVSIMPAEDYLGVNVFEIDSEITPVKDLDYYIQLLASYLAGRIAEEMYSHTLNAGASSDLAKATQLARAVITRYGLDTEFTQSRVYLCNEESPMNDELIAQINSRVDNLLNEARRYTEKLLQTQHVYLDLLAKTLIKKGMLSKKEIDTLFENYEKSLNSDAKKS